MFESDDEKNQFEQDIKDGMKNKEISKKYGISTDSVKRIDYNAFSGCLSLTKIFIPDSVEELSEGAFEGCESLTIASVPSSVDISGSFPDTTKIIIRS